MSEVQFYDSLAIIGLGFIAILILSFTHLVYWRRRKTDRVSYSRFTTFSFFILLIFLGLAVFSGLIWISIVTETSMMPVYPIFFFGLPAIYALVLAWGKKPKN